MSERPYVQHAALENPSGSACAPCAVPMRGCVHLIMGGTKVFTATVATARTREGEREAISNGHVR